MRTSLIPSLVLCEEIKQNIIFIVILETSITAVFHQHYTVADPDLELREGASFVLLGLSAILSPVNSSFLTQNKRGLSPGLLP